MLAICASDEGLSHVENHSSIIIIIIIILLKFKFNRFLNLHNPHITSLIETGCVTYNKIHYKYITVQIHYIIVKKIYRENYTVARRYEFYF